MVLARSTKIWRICAALVLLGIITSKLHSLNWRRLVDVAVAFGAIVALSGGFVYQDFRDYPDEYWYIQRFGPFFVPLAIALLYRAQFSNELVTVRLAKQFLSAWEQKAKRERDGWVCIAVFGWVGWHCLGAINRHLAFVTSIDLAIYSNACHEYLFSSIKGDVSLLADHFEPALLLFSPLCRTFDPAHTLLIVQFTFFALGALGVRQLAIAAGLSEGASLLATFAYVQFSGHLRTVYYDFHLVTLVLGVYPWMFYALLKRRFVMLGILILFASGLKESTALTLVGFAAYIFFTSRERSHKIGAVVLASLALGLFAIIMTVVYPYARGGEGSVYFAKYYGHIGKSLPEFIHTIVTRPLYVVGTFLTPQKLFYMFTFLWPFAYLPLLSPVVLLPALPALFVNLASNHEYMLSQHFHYEAEILPMTFCALLIALANGSIVARVAWLQAKFKRAPTDLAHSVPLILCIYWLIVGAGRGPEHYVRKFRPDDTHFHIQLMLDHQLPEFDVPIAANQHLAPHLAGRFSRLYLMDHPGNENDTDRAKILVLAQANRVFSVVPSKEFETELVPRVSKGFDLIYRDELVPSLRIWQRTPK